MTDTKKLIEFLDERIADINEAIDDISSMNEADRAGCREDVAMLTEIKGKITEGINCLCPHCEKGYCVIFDIREDFSSETGRIKCPHCGFVAKIISIQVLKLLEKD